MQLNISFETNQSLPSSIPMTFESMMISELSTALTHSLQYPVRIDTTQFSRNIVIYIQFPNTLMIIQTPKKRIYSTTTFSFLIWALAADFLILFFAIPFIKNQVRSVKRLADTAEKFGKGQNVKGFKPEGSREVRQAGQAFLKMRDRIQRQIETRTQMLSGVSHDLRTPFNPHEARARHDRHAKRKKKKNCWMILHKWKKMIEAYLTFAKGEEKEKTENISLTDFLEKLIARVQKTSAAKTLLKNASENKNICASPMRSSDA